MQLCQYPCQSRIRRFTVEAIQIPIVYNRYGDYDPNGLLYVLEQDSRRIQEEALSRFQQTPPQPYEEVQPLVLRANLGDTIKICFRNRLNRRLSIHVQGLAYDVAASDGTSAGLNPDSTTDDEIEYTWYADTEGVFLFHDMADPRSSEEATNIHGLFGAVIVEPPGAEWFHPETGEEMKSGLMADIYQPGKPAFREYTVFFHDELEILDKDGNPPVDHRTGLPSSTTAISYRSEPMRNRMPLSHDPADSGEDISMSSWVYGDPAPPILRAYVGDPAKIRLVHGGIKETHVFHLHNHQWRLETENPVSTIIDSITISPQECYTLDILYGAGSRNRVIGDVIFHCHLYPHFHEGMWTLWRIFDRLEDGTGELPDGTPIPALLPLPPCPGKDDVVRRYEVAAVQTELVYNRYGDHDPDGLIFVPLEDVDLVLAGKYTPKPLILRANVGDWLEVTLHNLWDPNRPVPYFDYPTVPLELKHKPSNRVSLNPQFLKYDPVCDSGINVGYNHKEQTVGTGESKRYLWKADREYGTCVLQSFGDMRNHRYHGLFGAVVIEPAGAQWYENFTKKKNPFAEQAVITAPGEETFREYVLFIQNGIRLLDAQGNLIRTAAGHGGDPVEAEDTGEKGYNYRSERFANRLSRDTRIWKVFSSKVHGDPATPLWKAYSGDRVIFRTMMPADKPRNVSLTIHGHLWREQPEDALSREIPLQGGISVGNRFDMELKDGAACPGDYLYRSGSFAWDVESGMWGIFRVMKHSIRCRCKEICGRIFRGRR